MKFLENDFLIAMQIWQVLWMDFPCTPRGVSPLFPMYMDIVVLDGKSSVNFLKKKNYSPLFPLYMDIVLFHKKSFAKFSREE